MKKAILSYGVLALFAAVLLFSCSKDKDENTEEQNQEETTPDPDPDPKPEPETPPAKRILGIWNIVREIEITKNKTTGTYKDTSSNIAIPAGIFTGDFRENGNLYLNLIGNPPQKDTLPYSFYNDATLLIDGQKFDLTNFTKERLTTTNHYFDGTDSVRSILEWKK